jgi:hypothetical protein
MFCPTSNKNSRSNLLWTRPIQDRWWTIAGLLGESWPVVETIDYKNTPTVGPTRTGPTNLDARESLLKCRNGDLSFCECAHGRSAEREGVDAEEEGDDGTRAMARGGVLAEGPFETGHKQTGTRSVGLAAHVVAHVSLVERCLAKQTDG